MWCFLFFAAVGLMLMVIGHYERRLQTMERTPRERVRIVPRTLYEEQLGVDFVSKAATA